ncbi:aldo/keto reductase [Paludibacter propionicigenes WB4]|uniref:Aldo/keto reductase n=1 Tax=Paludibacter propionicigenes (strain DSM 17365 / JCM 13257 / WB4) TaxID=694427 RepID=E4T7Q5_PALPW|nr:aldo/keto reductase [Paludibacter propionicigenes]ADQ80749.1 aldo/keto reductase [Paludibacter propionicigenes WB4]
MSKNNYEPAVDRYLNSVGYEYCGKSGLKLPRISLGLWHNFGDVDDAAEAQKMIQFAFDHGITHFDLANNYGTPYGSAERNFGRILKDQLSAYRDEMIISTKAGHEMWPGPYGDWGSRKYLIASLNQSLQRLQLDYVDIFYSHRYDPNTPLEETMGALSDVVKQGKALYVGISKYPTDKAREAYRILRENGTPCLINQDKYNIFTRHIEDNVLPLAQENGVGVIAFSPLSQGMLSDKYLQGIPENSRAAHSYGFLQKQQLTPEVIEKIKQLNEIAASRGQSLAQMALAWCFHKPEITSVIVGTSSVKQLQDNIDSLRNTSFTDDELWRIGELG